MSVQQEKRKTDDQNNNKVLWKIRYMQYNSQGSRKMGKLTFLLKPRFTKSNNELNVVITKLKTKN